MTYDLVGKRNIIHKDVQKAQVLLTYDLVGKRNLSHWPNLKNLVFLIYDLLGKRNHHVLLENETLEHKEKIAFLIWCNIYKYGL